MTHVSKKSMKRFKALMVKAQSKENTREPSNKALAKL